MFSCLVSFFVCTSSLCMHRLCQLYSSCSIRKTDDCVVYKYVSLSYYKWSTRFDCYWLMSVHKCWNSYTWLLQAVSTYQYKGKFTNCRHRLFSNLKFWTSVATFIWMSPKQENYTLKVLLYAWWQCHKILFTWIAWRLLSFTYTNKYISDQHGGTIWIAVLLTVFHEHSLDLLNIIIIMGSQNKKGVSRVIYEEKNTPYNLNYWWNFMFGGGASQRIHHHKHCTGVY